jgi:hypothetical protein
MNYRPRRLQFYLAQDGLAQLPQLKGYGTRKFLFNNDPTAKIFTTFGTLVLNAKQEATHIGYQKI